MENQKKVELQKIATKIRLGILEEIYSASSGHPGGSLSIADILTYLFFEKMNIDPKNPKMADRDRLVLSKGHTAPALYATLANRGYFDTALLKTFRNKDSILQGHPDMKHIPGVDMSSGSLGQGISAACGMALSAKLDKKDYKVYTILGDGEIEEGQVWEAAMFAAHYGLNNLCAFIDFNGLQIDGDVTKVMNPTPIDAKFEAFGWNVAVINGHDLDEIEKAVAEAEKSDKPFAIIAKCVKGKGVSFMENEAGWHGNAPNTEQYEQAKAELEAALAALN
jgi:transketolase